MTEDITKALADFNCAREKFNIVALDYQTIGARNLATAKAVAKRQRRAQPFAGELRELGKSFAELTPKLRGMAAALVEMADGAERSANSISTAFPAP